MIWSSTNVGTRERLAKLLGKAGGTAAILRARARLRLPVLSILTYHHVCERRPYWWDRIAYIVATSMRERIQLTYPRAMTVELRDRAAARATLVRPVKDEAGLDLERYLLELAAAVGITWTRDVETKLADEL